MMNVWIIIALLAIIAAVKLMAPEFSYEWKISMWIAAVGAIIFGVRFYLSVATEDFTLWHLFFCLLCGQYIMAGGKSVALKTMTGVFSKVTKQSVGVMKAGSLNWADPLFEVVTISVDGVPNISADLQKLKIKIVETPLMQTDTRGIQAKVKNISFMLSLDEDRLKELLDIEGGVITVRERIGEYIEEIILIRISQISPEDLDQDKKRTIENLASEIEDEVNHFCERNDYPYFITDNVIIGDTELEKSYYEALAKEQLAILEARAKDADAERLQKRIFDFGRKLLPGQDQKIQIEAAMIALNIVKKDISEKKYGIDPFLADLAKDLATILKK